MDSDLAAETALNAYRILPEEHTLCVPLELISQVFGVERGTIYNHWREYKARYDETRHAIRSPAFFSQELDEIIADILHGFQQWRPLTLPEIVSIVQKKFQKCLLPDPFIIS
jgi:hypothetical protein